jgi:hypothetical protein
MGHSRRDRLPLAAMSFTSSSASWSARNEVGDATPACHPYFDGRIDEPEHAEQSVVQPRKMELVDRLMMSDPVPEPVQFGHWVVDVASTLREQVREGMP